MPRGGFLNIHKPRGLTSFAAVARLRRISGIRRIGHLGTLDPAAAGVLPMAVGTATRLIEYISGGKSYRASVHLGIVTDTLDAEGEVVSRHDFSHVTEEQTRSVLAAMVGEQMQVPPMASALHHGGQRLYQLFRQGKSVEVPPRLVRLDRIEMLEFDPPRLVIEVDCGPGTYIRSLARDIGERLGCGAHLSDLLRTQSGPFPLAEARTPAQVESILQAGGSLSQLYVPLSSLLKALPWLVLRPAGVSAIRAGCRIGAHEIEDIGNLKGNDVVCVLAGPDDEVVAIGRAFVEAATSDVTVRPVKVLPPSGEGGNE